MNRENSIRALQVGQDAIAALIAAIEGHHATSLCESQALLAAARRQYQALDTIRAVLGKAER